MKPVDQTKLHNPPINGNCMNAAFASILELDIEDIPQFEDMNDIEWYPKLLRWLEKIGFHLIRWDQEIYLPSYFIANGPSPRGVEHSVVYKGIEMVHDPHPSRTGLEKITSVWALLPLDPVRYNQSFKEKAEQSSGLAIRASEAKRLVLKRPKETAREETYKKALEDILDYWWHTQDAPVDQSRIQWAEDMAGIACDALSFITEVD